MQSIRCPTTKQNQKSGSRGEGNHYQITTPGLLSLQIITALEEDPTAQKMQLGYRLQQIAAAVENKVTDL